MTRINANFFNIAQDSAKMATNLTSNGDGEFDWDVAMSFLKMAYYRASIEEVESYNRDLEILLNDGEKTGKA